MEKTTIRRLQCAAAVGVILLFRIVRYCSFELPVTVEDSRDYINFDWSFFTEHFVVNSGRAPLYPFLIAACRIFGSHYLDVLVLFQMVLSLTALFALYEILKMLGVNYVLRLLLVVFYGVSPAICGWDGCVLTESLSLTFMVWFFYAAVRYIKFGGGKSAVASTLIAFAMSFLRPQFLYVFAALFVFFVLKSLFEETKTKTNRKILAVMVVQMGLILIYCANFKAVYGIFSLTDALPRQNLKICVDRDYYKNLENQDVAQVVEQGLKANKTDWEAVTTAVGQFGNAEVAYQTKKYFTDNLGTYLCDTLDVAMADLTTPFDGYDARATLMKKSAPGIAYKIIRIQNALFKPLTVGWALLAAALSGVAMLYVWVIGKKMPWIHMALFSISVCTTYLTYFVTCAEYMRTMVGVLPLLCIMAGMFLQWICTKSAQESEQV